MSSMASDCDIIIITGGNAVGKTTSSNYLRKLAAQRGITYESRIVSDSECLFEAMLKDDKDGGLHHTHSWCENQPDHTHNSAQPIFPFTVTDNELPRIMRDSFFKKVQSLESNGNLWFVEWAAGVNTNPSGDPASCIDYSYKIAKQLMYERKIPDEWLSRVKVVLHITAEESIRYMLNNKRSVPLLVYPEALGEGSASWFKDEKVIKFYGRDDFSEIECIFNEIPIQPLINDGTPSFFQKLEEVADVVFGSRIPEFV